MKLAIGFITYGNITAKYLPYFLPSLKEALKGVGHPTRLAEANGKATSDCGEAQVGCPTPQIIAIDNSETENNENAKYITKNYPEIKVSWPGRNLGFAKANNIIIKQAIKLGAEYVLFLNPDIILEPDTVKNLLKAIEENKELGSVSPKILQWDFKANKKTDIIDTCGIALKSGLRFIDLGQGQLDQGQFDKAEILGPSGAAAMYRVEALKKIEEKAQYFDELMFMHKEDCDLAYRLSLAGYKSKCVYEAIIWHDRTVSGLGLSSLKIALNRFKKSKQEKKWSFLYQHVIYLKYWSGQKILNKFIIIWQAFKMFVFVLLFEQYLLAEYINIWKLKSRITMHHKNAR